MKKLTFFEILFLIVFSAWLFNAGKFANGSFWAYAYLAAFSVGYLTLSFLHLLEERRQTKLIKETEKIVKSLTDDKPTAKPKPEPKTP